MKSKRNIRSRLRPFLKRCNGRSLEAIIQKVNPILRGWYGYFKPAGYSDLLSMDGWVRMRLRSVLRKRRGGKGRGRGRDHQRWPDAYFVERGLFTMRRALAKELESPTG